MNKIKKLIAVTGIVFTLGGIAVAPALAKEGGDKDRDDAPKQGIFMGRGAVIGNANVDSKGTDSLTISKDGKSYTVSVDEKTRYRRRFWGKSSFDEIQVNDKVNVFGKWTDSNKTTIQATLIRDLSIRKFNGVFFGEVKSLTSNGWVMTTVKRGDQTVTYSSSTKFINRTGATITAADVKVGDKVRVRGLWDSNTNTITEVSAVKDFNIPVKE